jgi:hypothetical protein
MGQCRPNHRQTDGAPTQRPGLDDIPSRVRYASPSPTDELGLWREIQSSQQPTSCKDRGFCPSCGGVLGVFVPVLLGFQRHRARLYGPRLFRGCRLEPSRAACRERPPVAIPRETEHFQLAGGSHAEQFGDAPRAGWYPTSCPSPGSCAPPAPRDSTPPTDR